MDFKSVTEKLLTAFNDQNLRYALIGGYAVGLWGVARGTLDMDFLVMRDDLDKIDGIMGSLGYDLHFRSENVSHYIAAVSRFGSVDFLHAFRSHSLKMLERAVEKELFGEHLPVRVLMPEDLIGLKVQAIANNEERRLSDMNDIEELMRLHGDRLDWAIIEDYFAIFEMKALFAELKGRFHGI